MTAIAPELLETLRCPDTHQSLKAADPGLLERLNQLIAAGKLRNQTGQPVTGRLDGGLVRADGKILYAIRQGIAVLLPDEGIPL